MCPLENPSSGRPCHTHVGRSHTFSLPVHHSTQHYLDRATFSKTPLYTDNHFRKNLYSLFQNNFLVSPCQQTQSGPKTTLKNHSQILNVRVPVTTGIIAKRGSSSRYADSKYARIGERKYSKFTKRRFKN